MLKAEVINQAYSAIRISGLTTQAIPEDVTLAIRELDQMMWQWFSIGRVVNYNFPLATTDGELIQSDPNEPANLYPWAISGVINSLALRLVSYFGMEPPAVLAAAARYGTNVIKQRTVKIITQQYPRGMPLGSGNTQWGGGYGPKFFHPSYPGREHTTPIILSQNLDLECDFASNLAEGDTIASYTIEADANGGVSLVSHSQAGTVIYYRVLAESNKNGSISIVVTTADGLVIPKAYCFTTQENSCVVTMA